MDLAVVIGTDIFFQNRVGVDRLDRNATFVARLCGIGGVYCRRIYHCRVRRNSFDNHALLDRLRGTVDGTLKLIRAGRQLYQSCRSISAVQLPGDVFLLGGTALVGCRYSLGQRGVGTLSNM